MFTQPQLADPALATKKSTLNTLENVASKLIRSQPGEETWGGVDDRET